MIASHRILPVEILCIFIDAIQKVRHLGRGKKSTKKAANDTERRACSHKALIILQRATKRVSLIEKSELQ